MSDGYNERFLPALNFIADPIAKLQFSKYNRITM